MSGERDWLLPCAVLVAAQWVVAFLIAWSVDFVIHPPIAETLWFAFVVTWPIAAVVILLGVRGRWSFTSLKDAVDYQSRPLVAMILGMFVAAMQMALLSWCKTLMPHYSGGFWADPMLADLDYAIFGVEPWVWLQAIPVRPAIQVIYTAWIPVTTFALVALFLSPPSASRTRAIVAFFVIFAFGAFGQFLLPSAGPVFYHLAGWGDRFGQVPDGYFFSGMAPKWMWEFHLAGVVRVGGGISAMPSMHVAEAAWLVLVAKHIWPRVYWPSVAFFVAILFGSVYTGFHYVSDGVVGALTALAAWRIAEARMMKLQPYGIGGLFAVALFAALWLVVPLFDVRETSTVTDYGG